MTRVFFFLFIILAFGLLFLQGRTMNRNNEKPIFLQVDEIALNHQTQLKVTVQSSIIPSEVELEQFKNDYSNLWAHLNHLYSTNDLLSGKEYYTESWFRQLANHYDPVIKPTVSRTDQNHDLFIKNWSSDGLVCTAIDSNVVMKYSFPDQTSKTQKVNLAVVLLFQGDHWRIDAMKVMSEPL